MNNTNHRKTFIFAHIPKTGGTSIRVHCQKHLKDQVEFIHLANKGDRWAKAQGYPVFESRPAPEREKARVILGHRVNKTTAQLVPDPVQIVIFRDPTSWEISRYNQYCNRRKNEGAPPISFLEWSKTEKLHSQFDWFLAHYWLLGRRVKKMPTTEKEDLLHQILQDDFSHVFFTESLDHYMKPIYQNLGIPSKAKKENVVGVHKINFFSDTKENRNILQDLVYNDLAKYNQLKKTYG